ncbi:Dps family protein [Paenibacillus lutrae]|uniref:DNA starvation/stationary phase protection protein n=1 Tax=Paenibacillus lutrae TaxID=2078573 RepID=A0A7X3FIN7_9BACL|nr:DNA starvation/stationary phase protection protein [Paenibacillus lutrae]MVP00199.1 DNA starvation/stationary phase protection protein [Paenibacillus lutrae]
MTTMTAMTTNQHLIKLTADWNVFSMKLRHYHWNVKGPHFYTLHAKFEELYNEAGQYVDEFAERVLALGGKPIGTYGETLQETRLKEASGKESSEEMVAAIREDFLQMVAFLQEGIETAQQENDEPTADMLIGTQGNLQKHIWMLGAFLDA